MLQKRILGLTSYFKSADEKLLPKFDKVEDINEISVEMSPYQLGIYEKARVAERKEEKNNAKKFKGNKVTNLYSESTSTYRIFSRAFCNFVFPPGIKRPMPNDSLAEEAEITKSLDKNEDITTSSEEGGESKGTTLKAKDFNTEAVHFFNEGGVESDINLVEKEK